MLVGMPVLLLVSIYFIGDFAPVDGENLTCTRELTIKPSWAPLSNGQFSIRYNDSLVINARARYNGSCPALNATRWEWKLHGLNLNNESIELEAYQKRAHLKLEGNILQYGSHMLTVAILAEGEPVAQNKIKFEVRPTPLVVTVKGGHFVTFGPDTVPAFDASESFDPDGMLQPDKMQFAWSCYAFRSIGVDICNDDETPLNVTGPKLRLPLLVNKGDTNMRVTVTVTGFVKGILRTGKAWQNFEIKMSAVPFVTIKCLYNCGTPFVSRSEKVIFAMECPECKPAKTLDWEWDIKQSAVNLYNNGSMAVIRPNSFDKPLSRYTVEGYASYPGQPAHDRRKARVGLNVTTPSEMSPGQCDISPKTGIALITPYRVTCAGTDSGALIVVYQLAKGSGEGTLLRYEYGLVVEDLFLVAEEDGVYTTTVRVNVTDRDYTWSVVHELSVSVFPVEGQCAADVVECVRGTVAPEQEKGTLKFLEEMVARGDDQGALHLGQGLMTTLAVTNVENMLPSLKMQTALLELLLKVSGDSVMSVLHSVAVLQKILRATRPFRHPVVVKDLAMEVGMKVSKGILDLAKDKRPIYRYVVEMSRALVEAVGTVYAKGPANKTGTWLNETGLGERSGNDTVQVPVEALQSEDVNEAHWERDLRNILDTLAEAIAGHMVSGESATIVRSSVIQLTVVRARYGDLARETQKSKFAGLGSQKGLSSGFVKLYQNERLDSVPVTAHVVELAKRSLGTGTVGEVTTRTMELKVKREDQGSFITDLGPVDYYLYSLDNAVLKWVGPLPLRVKMPQDYNADDISARKGILAPNVREPFDVAVLARTHDPSTALEIKVNAVGIPKLDEFSPHSVKEEAADLDHPTMGPVRRPQYVVYVQEEDLLPMDFTYHVGVLPFRNLTFHSHNYFEEAKYSLSMQSIVCHDIGAPNRYKNCRAIKGNFTTLWSTACRCGLVTRVGASMRAVSLNENKADIQFFLLITSNPSAIAFVGIVLMTYVFVMLVAWVIDKRYSAKCGVTILKDSDPGYSKQYVVAVSTGSWITDGTTSKVAVRFNGTMSSSDAHVLADGRDTVFLRGGEDRFLLSTKRSLGPMKSVDVWMDASGPNPTWFLHKIVLVDVSTKDMYVFIVNEWFGTPADKKSKTLVTAMTVPLVKERDAFRSLFIRRIWKGIQNRHLWLSLFLRWPSSCFKCVHRATALLVLVLFAAFINLVLRGLPGENSRRLYTVPVKHATWVSESDLCTALLSTCILIGVQLLFVQLLRKQWECDKWEPHAGTDDRWMLRIPSKPSPVPREKASPPPDDKVEFVTVVIEEDGRQVGYDLKFERKGAKSPTVPGPSQPEEEGIAEEEEEDEEEETPEEEKERKETKERRRALREWANGFTWVTLAAIVLTLSGLNIVYGLRMTKDDTYTWVLSTVISLAFSAFIFEPLAVVAIAAIGASHGQEKLLPPVGWRAEAIGLYAKTVYLSGTLEEYRRYLNRLRAEMPIYNEKLARGGKKRLVHLERHDGVMVMLVCKIVSFITFIGFLWILMIEIREDYSYYSTATINQLVILNSFATNTFTGSDQVYDALSFYAYLRFNLVPSLQPNRPINIPEGDERDALPWTATGATFTVGAIRIRQLRSVKVKCPVVLATNVSYTARDRELAAGNCIPWFSTGVEEKLDFGVGWATTLWQETPEDDLWKYKSPSLAPAMTASGNFYKYPGGGYVATLVGRQNESLALVTRMARYNWIDQLTRAVIIEFSTMSPFVNLLGVAQLVFEFPPIGGVVVSSYVDSFRPIHYLGYTRPGVLVCYALMVAFCVILAGVEAHKFAKLGRFYFSDGWNLVNVAIVILSYVYFAWIYTSFGISGDPLDETAKQISSVSGSLVLEYLDPSAPVLSNSIGTMVLTALGTISMAKLWKLLSFNRHLHSFVLTLRFCVAPLTSFVVMFFLVYMAFASFAHIMFGDSERDMSTLASAVATMFFMTIGSVKYNTGSDQSSSMKRLSRMAFYAGFVCVVIVYMVSMFVAIILRSFRRGSLQKERMKNRYEVISFLVTKLRALFGKGHVQGYRRCVETIRGRNLARLKESADMVEKMTTVSRTAVRYLTRMIIQERKTLHRRKSRHVQVTM